MMTFTMSYFYLMIYCFDLIFLSFNYYFTNDLIILMYFINSINYHFQLIISVIVYMDHVFAFYYYN